MKRAAALLVFVATLAWAGEPETVSLPREQIEAMVKMILEQRAVMVLMEDEIIRARKAERDAKAKSGCV